VKAHVGQRGSENAGWSRLERRGMQLASRLRAGRAASGESGVAGEGLLCSRGSMNRRWIVYAPSAAGAARLAGVRAEAMARHRGDSRAATGWRIMGTVGEWRTGRSTATAVLEVGDNVRAAAWSGGGYNGRRATASSWRRVRPPHASEAGGGGIAATRGCRPPTA